MAKAVTMKAPTPVWLYEEPPEDVQRQQAVMRIVREIFGYAFDDGEKVWAMTKRIIGIADAGGEVDTNLIDELKGAHSAEVIAALLDRLRRCPEFRELAYGDPAPDGFVGRVDWNKMGANAYMDPY